MIEGRDLRRDRPEVEPLNYDHVCKPRTPELDRPLSKQDFGTVASGRGWNATIAEQPIPLRLDRVFDRLGKPIPPEIDLYQGFDVWLIPNRVAVMRRRGFAAVVSIGLDCDYASGRATRSIAGLVPQPEYVSLGGVSTEATCAGKIGFAGDVTAGGSEADGSENVVFENGIKLSAGAAVDAHVNFSFAVATPRIAAIGVGSAIAQWQFKLGGVPLFGRDIETWTFLVLPKMTRKLAYRIRLYLVMRTAFIPTRVESEWIEIECKLPT